MPAGEPDAAAKRLSAGIARGDAAALDEFYRSWFDWAYAMAARLTRRDEAFCLDVVQDAVLRAARSMKRMESHADLERWMVRVVHTTALDRLRRESRRLRRERAGADADRAQDAAQIVELKERAAWVRARLADLPAADGWLVWLRIGRGRSLADTGTAAGIGAQAAHGRVRRAVARLRADELRAEEVAGEAE
jgi:RNA polymerase sigma factor (sigma-70 family)